MPEQIGNEEIRSTEMNALTDWKAVNLKKYEVLEDFVVKKTGVVYKKGFYEWVYIPKDIPQSYRNRYLSKIIWLT